MKKIWPFSFYFLYFSGIAAFAPYMVLLFQSLDFTGAQIGLLMGITPLITLVSVPLWTGIADSTNRHKLIMSIAILVEVIGLFLLPVLKGFALIFILGITINFFFAPVAAFADSASMFMLKDRKDLIGRLRLGGTIGFGITASVVGLLVNNFGLKIAFWSAGGLYLIGFLVSQQLAHGGEVKEQPSVMGQVGKLLKDPSWILFLFAAFTCGIAFAATNIYLFPFMKELGASETLMGIALTVGTIVEIPVLLFSNLFIKRFRAFNLLIFSMVMTGLRLILFSVSGSPTLALVAQLLNGFAFPVTWVAGVSFADEFAPKGLRSTAQGLFSGTSMGLGSAVGGFFGGIIFENIGGRGLNLVYGMVVFAVLTIVWLMWKRLPSRKVQAV